MKPNGKSNFFVFIVAIAIIAAAITWAQRGGGALGERRGAPDWQLNKEMPLDVRSSPCAGRLAPDLVSGGGCRWSRAPVCAVGPVRRLDQPIGVDLPMQRPQDDS